MTTIAPYGTWASPISAADTVQGVVGFAELARDDDRLYWVEMRPTEGGRQVIVRMDPEGNIEDALPDQHHARTMVHEYGGGALTVGGGRVVFSAM